MSSRTCSLSPIPLRLIMGLGMAYHGYPKVFDAAQHEQFTGMLTGMGIPSPEMSAWFLGGLELFGGLLLVVGALTRLVSALLVVEMAVAAWQVHWPNGFLAAHVVGTGADGPIWGAPGWEVNALYIAGFLALLIGGAGRYSVDHLFTRRRRIETTFEAGPPPAGSTPRERVSPWRRRRSEAPRRTSETSGLN
jgi:putative oxidoreductase